MYRVSNYDPKTFFCEMSSNMEERSPQLESIWNRFDQADFDDLTSRAKDADMELFQSRRHIHRL